MITYLKKKKVVNKHTYMEKERGRGRGIIWWRREGRNSLNGQGRLGDRGEDEIWKQRTRERKVEDVATSM